MFADMFRSRLCKKALKFKELLADKLIKIGEFSSGLFSGSKIVSFGAQRRKANLSFAFASRSAFCFCCCAYMSGILLIVLHVDVGTFMFVTFSWADRME